ncbi:terpene synthase family protein [Actinomadura rubrisoli]|uniref:Terpene synthase n=1 Tax=Actinomadura rubrisoli TaxID=2530368 RepID=A0A4R5A5J5_9ACTN|nr:hypothetical protein [Actinomadura rubrisoli]TDD65914.1 hypothetical protein E1298_40910 [Actinomadura rubrisoli]
MVETYPRELPVYCPWPDQLCTLSDWKDLDAKAVDWYGSRGLPEPRELYTNTLSGYGICRVYPRAVNKTVLQLMTQHAVWVGFFDDHITARDTPPQHVRACLAGADRVFDTPSAPLLDFCPYLSAERYLAEHLQAAVPESTWVHVASGWRAWLTCIVPGRAIGTLDDYLSWRFLDVCGPYFAAGTLVTGDYTLTSQEWFDPRAVAVRQAMGLLAGIDNDLAAPNPEPNSPNILDIMAEHHGVTRIEAVERAVALRDLLACRLEHLVTQLTARDGERLARHASDVAQMVRGHLDWYEFTHRYRERPGTIRPITLTPTTAHPDHDCLAPPPAPSAAWWWDLGAGVSTATCVPADQGDNTCDLTRPPARKHQEVPL